MLATGWPLAEQLEDLREELEELKQSTQPGKQNKSSLSLFLPSSDDLIFPCLVLSVDFLSFLFACVQLRPLHCEELLLPCSIAHIRLSDRQSFTVPAVAFRVH